MSALFRLFLKKRLSPDRIAAAALAATSSHFPDVYRPAIWRGATAFDRRRRLAALSFATYDGEWHQFLLFDHDLERLGQAIAEMLPRVEFAPREGA